jgi:hypothetical protein
MMPFHWANPPDVHTAERLEIATVKKLTDLLTETLLRNPAAGEPADRHVPG